MSVFHNVPGVPREKMERWNACIAARKYLNRRENKVFLINTFEFL
jgi:hypothetical protein